MKIILKKFIIILLVICIFISSLFSGIVQADDTPEAVLTQERAGNYASSFAINFFENWSNEGFEIVGGEETAISGQRRVAMRGKVTTEYSDSASVTGIVENDTSTYIFSNQSWINFVYKYSLSMAENDLTSLLSNFDNEDEIFKDELIKSGDIIDITKLVNEGRIFPGDVLYAQNGNGGGQYLLYVGGTKVLYAAPIEGDSSDKFEKNSAIRYDYLQYYFQGIKEDLLEGHEEEKDYEIPQYGVTKIYRIKQSYLDGRQLTQDDVNLTFNKKGYFVNGKYQGTPDKSAITLNATEEVSFKWIFDALSGLFELLINTILYAIRMQVIGWVNVIELMFQSVILGISGNANTQMFSNFFGPDATSATGSRISVESIFFNQIPILDANFFNFETAGGYSLTTTTMYQPATASGMGAYEVSKVDENNIVYQLRKNLLNWYIIVRNASIAILLFVLVYLGVRLAFHTIAEKKAAAKMLLSSWFFAFAVVLLIHIFMYLVFFINDELVGVCKDLSENFASDEVNSEDSEEQTNKKSQELTLYDAVRVKAYSFNFREGVPATIIYIYLVYMLIRFSYVYLKRYLAIYILAIVGSFMGVRYALEKIAGKKSVSLSNWFKDFGFNVILQTVHAFLYTVYMGVAISVSGESLGGFLLCMLILNAMVHADKILINIFGLNKASTLSDVLKPESYVDIFTKFAPMFTIYKGMYDGAQKYLFGKRGVVSEIRYSLNGIDNYKDADNFYENSQYNRIARMQKIKDSIQNKIYRNKLGRWVIDKGLSIDKLDRYAEHKRALGKDISLKQKRRIYKSMQDSKQLRNKRFTRPLGFAKDLFLTQAGALATVALTIEDPLKGIQTFNKTKKRISSHITMSKAQRKNQVYKNSKAPEKQAYKVASLEYRRSVLDYIDDKYGYKDDLKRLQRELNNTNDKNRKKIIEQDMSVIQKNRVAAMRKLKKKIKKMEVNGTQSSDPELRDIQDKYRKMYTSKSDIHLNADYKKAKKQYKDKLDSYVNRQYNYESQIKAKKEALATTSDINEQNRFINEISQLQKDKQKDEAKGLQEIQEAYEKMQEQKVIFRNAKHENNMFVKVAGTFTGATGLAQMAQNEMAQGNSDKKKANKEQKRFEELRKMSDDEEALRGAMRTIKSNYNFNDEASVEKYDDDMAELLTDSKRTVIKSSTIKSVITSYMNDNIGVKKINEDNINDVLEELEKKLRKQGSDIIISDSLKSEVKKQLEDKMIKDKKGLGYNRDDATVAIETILSEEGIIQTVVSKSDVKEAVSEHMASDSLKADGIDDMITEVQDKLRIELPEHVKDEIKHELETKLSKPENSGGLNKKDVSDVVNSEIRKNNIEDTSSYHESLTRAQIEELKSRGIAINTEAYYQYLQNNGIDYTTHKANNEAKQKLREINIRNENAKVKLGGSIADLSDIFKEAKK